MTEKRASALLAENLSAIYGYAYARMYDKEKADDLAAEIVYEVITSAHNLKNEEAFWGYAWRIAENTLRRFLRKTAIMTVEWTDDNVCCYTLSPEEEYIQKEEEADTLYLLRRELSLLKKLRRKYNMDEEAMLTHLDDCRRKFSELEYAGDMLIKLNKQLEKHIANCKKIAAELSEKRRATAESLEKRIVSELKDLSMPSVRFSVSVEPMESDTGFDATGADNVKFLISANAGEALGRISKIASGGELSRIMLAMKTVFSKNDPIETMVFDEIDTGVSGIAAQRVGEKMSDLSRGKQVLCITHLPQIAAIADNHDLIEKTERNGRTYTEVRELDRKGRALELARMHGGDNISELTLASAEEQLLAADKYRLTRNN